MPSIFRGAFALIVLTCTSSAFATWDASLFERRSLALQHYGVPTEPDFQNFLLPWSGRQDRINFEAALSVLDPTGELSEYATWDDRRLMVFQDRGLKSVPDFSVSFAPSDARPDFLPRVTLMADNPLDFPLRGLKVALDPGHFGNEIDEHVGKVVRHSGVTLREGAIALQTCLLIANKLMDLGVQREDILVTRTTNQPVTQVPYDDFPLTEYARHEFLNSADEPWFQYILRRANSVANMLSLFANASEATQLFVDRDRNPDRWGIIRTQLFALVAELTSRAEVINAFQPDVTVILHYDTAGGGLQRRVNHVKAFVPGEWLTDELGTRAERYAIVRHALDTPRWMRSVRLSSRIVNAISAATGVAVNSSSLTLRGRAVAAGVYTRNLVLNRLITETDAISYVESLFYNNTDEFNRLSVFDQTSDFDGRVFEHSSRVNDVAEGVVNGILDYVRDSAATSSDTTTP